MGTMCKGVLSVLFLLAGVVLFANISLAGFSAIQLTGIMLILIALGKLMHVGGMCPTCSAEMSKGKKR